MANDLHTVPESSVTALVSGIIDDAQELFKQQVALLKHELKDEIRQTKEAALSLAWGVGFAVIGGLLLCVMLPLLLHWGIPAIPLWGCFAIVGGILAVIGGGLIYTATQKLEAINPVPPQSVEALRENLQLRP
jgi:Putative Actinobacterial Holin-X, holin superfamily III